MASFASLLILLSCTCMEASLFLVRHRSRHSTEQATDVTAPFDSRPAGARTSNRYARSKVAISHRGNLARVAKGPHTAGHSIRVAQSRPSKSDIRDERI